MAWHDKLNALQEARGWTVPELAREMGHPDDKELIDRIHKWKAGGVKQPRGNALKELARAFNVTTAELRDDEPEVLAFRPPPKFLGDRDLPVYSSAEGGQGTMVVNTDPIEWVPRPWYLGNVRDGYAVLVVGDSMEPVFEAGDMAVVNPRLPPRKDKNVVLVSRESEGEFVATIKRLLGWTDKDWKLRQFNPRRDFTLSKKEWPKALRVVGKYDG